MSRDLPIAVLRNPYVDVERDSNDQPIAAYLNICTCGTAYSGPDSNDPCEHIEQIRTLVWKKEIDPPFLYRRFQDSAANEEGVILTQVNSTSFLVQIREISERPYLTWDQYLTTAALRVVPLSTVNTWRIFAD
jgi:hypothetical protein